MAKLDTARKKGLRWCLFCKIYSYILKGLKNLYGFDQWHADNPITCRPYKLYIANLLNGFNPKVVVEVGCGLGDIICATTAKKRYGLDPDQGAIGAAKLLHPFSDVRWLRGDLSNLNFVGEDNIDILVAVGWVHLVSPDYLKACILPHGHRIKYIILDKFTEWSTPPFRA